MGLPIPYCGSAIEVPQGPRYLLQSCYFLVGICCRLIEGGQTRDEALTDVIHGNVSSGGRR